MLSLSRFLMQKTYTGFPYLIYTGISNGLLTSVAVLTVLILWGVNVWATQGKKEPERTQVVVVGAGMAGLTAAYFLKDRDVIVLEKTNHCGGIIDSGSFGGFNYPKGPAYIGLPQGPIRTMIAEMGLEPVEIPEPSQSFYYDATFYVGIKGISKLLTEKSSSEEYSRFVREVKNLSAMYTNTDYTTSPAELAELDGMSAQQWFKSKKFPPIFQEIYDSQARGFFGTGLQQISALSFIPEIGFQFDAQVSKRKLNDSEQTEETPDKEKGSGAYTFTNGLSELPEAIFRKLGHKRVRLECNVSSIKPTDKLYQVHYVDKSGLERIVETEAVIIATPAPTALKIAAEALTEAQKKILGNIQYSSYTTVALFCSSPIFDKSFDLGVGNKFVFTDLYDGSWVQRAFDRDSSKTKERVLCAHVPDYHPDNLLDGSSDVELVGKVIADLGKIFPHAEANIVGHDVKTTTLAYPVMQPGAYENIAKLNDLNQGRVLLAGQYMIYPTIEAAIESGYLAAIKLDADLGGQNSAAEQPAQE